jgi:hypothetical protein
MKCLRWPKTIQDSGLIHEIEGLVGKRNATSQIVADYPGRRSGIDIDERRMHVRPAAKVQPPASAIAGGALRSAGVAVLHSSGVHEKLSLL